MQIPTYCIATIPTKLTGNVFPLPIYIGSENRQDKNYSELSFSYVTNCDLKDQVEQTQVPLLLINLLYLVIEIAKHIIMGTL